MREHTDFAALRQNPREWHRRGLSSPTEIDALVSARLGQCFRAGSFGSSPMSDPSYADFFVVDSVA